MTATQNVNALDLEDARQKNNEEREKRMRADHNSQYIDVLADGEFGEFDRDPYVTEVIDRAAITREVEVVIVGAGLSGVTAAVELAKAGVEDVWMIDKAGDFGGTWYWNRYPGVRCDVESYIYLQYLDETGYVPSEKYTTGDEIWRHFRRIADKWNLYERAVFQTRITSVVWQTDVSRWEIRTNRGDTFLARYVIHGTGPLSLPKLPALDGIKDFKGKIFLSSRWDYEYTGGDQTGGMTNLRDKKVAIIGTGASSIQAVPFLAEAAEQLYVFQRTPSIVDSRNNRPTDPNWFSSQPAGWLEARAANFDSVLAGLPHGGDVVGDQWGQIWGGVAEIIEEAGSDFELMGRKLAERDLAEMQRIRDRVESIVADPDTAEALKPYYDRFCKRPTFNDEYLESFNRPNVTLVDTEGKGVQNITPRGVLVDGNEYEVDCIIFATGFELSPGPARAGGFDIIGEGGRSWGEERKNQVATLHGIMTSGYPNMFIVGGQHHAAVTINLPLVFKAQATHIAKILTTLASDGVVAANVTAEAEQAWAETIAAKSVYSEAATAQCTPGNWNNEGDLSAATVWKTRYGAGPFEYMQLLDDWRDTDIQRDLRLSKK